MSANGTNLILGGALAPAAQFPFFTTIYHNDQFSCSGVIVAPHLVLSAAHCVGNEDQGKYKVVISDGSNEKQSVSLVAKHPCYEEKKGQFFADIAMFWIDPEKNKNAKVATLSRQMDYPIGDVAIALGAGATETTSNSFYPLQAELPIQANEYCEKVFDVPNQGWQICAGGQGKDVCRGEPCYAVFIIMQLTTGM
jgi:hypothetical protein